MSAPGAKRRPRRGAPLEPDLQLVMVKATRGPRRRTPYRYVCSEGHGVESNRELNVCPGCTSTGAPCPGALR